MTHISTAHVSTAHKVIKYSEVEAKIPTRDKFLPPLVIDKEQPLLFLPSYLKESNAQPAPYKKGQYAIMLRGVLKTGHPANVIITGILPYFSIKIPDSFDKFNKLEKSIFGENKEEFIEKVRDVLEDQHGDEVFEYENITFRKAKPLMGYQENMSDYIFVYYTRTKNRKVILDKLIKRGYTTASNDASCYYRVACRDNLTTFSSWSVLTDYKVHNFSDKVREKDNFTYLKGLTIIVDIKNYKPYTGPLTDDLMKDKQLCMSWDLETYTTRAGHSNEDMIPLPKNKDDRIICAGMSFQWLHDKKPFLRLCACDKFSAPVDNATIIVCDSETQIIKCFADCVAKLKPDYITGFNDHNYDWPWIAERSIQIPGLIKYVCDKLNIACFEYEFITRDDAYYANSYYKTERVKIDAQTSMSSLVLRLPGYIPIDTHIIFRRQYPTDEKSGLGYYLDKFKLNGKDHMPYKLLKEINCVYETFLAQHKFPPGYQYGDRNVAVKIRGEVKIVENPEDLILYDTPEDFDEGTAKPTWWNPIIIKELTPSSSVVNFKSLCELFAAINRYCIVDAERCHELLNIKNVFFDNREISNMSYTSVNDSYYRANGLKVRNLIIARGTKRPFNLQISNCAAFDKEDTVGEKFPGAHVYPPKKGLKITKLSIRERIKKAYLTRNKKIPAHQEWLPLKDDEARIANLEHEVAEYYQTGTCKSLSWKPFADFVGEVNGRPIAGLDFSSLYPSIMRCYNISPEYFIKSEQGELNQRIKGHVINKVEFEYGNETRSSRFIWHDNYLNASDANFKFGIFPFILNELFEMRTRMKKEQAVLDKEIEHLDEERSGPDFNKKYACDAGDNAYDKWQDHYDLIVLKRNYIKGKQTALKVFMNTFYGEIGNAISPMFLVEAAGGVTSWGQLSIKAAHAYVCSVDCLVYYGDTDSLYISVPERYFADLDARYFSGQIDKLTYWKSLVDISFANIIVVARGVNKMFFELTKTAFLSMAYEEFLFPSFFAAKKKYFGIEHKEIANFNRGEKGLFIKGLDTQRRGVSNLVKIIIKNLMLTVLDASNVFTMLELVYDAVDMIYATDWKLSDFAQSDMYRPNKKNVKIHTFVRRMRTLGIVITPNERFNYVIVKRFPYVYDYRGRKTKLQVGDKIELEETVTQQKLEIDLDYYMENRIIGQLARLVTDLPAFHKEPRDNSREEVKRAEEGIHKNAKKFLNNYASGNYKKFIDPGNSYKKLFRDADRVLSEKIHAVFEPKKTDSSALVSSGNIALTILNKESSAENYIEWLEHKAQKIAIKKVSGFGETLLRIYANSSNQLTQLDQLCFAHYGKTKDNYLNIYKNLFENSIRNIRGQINLRIKDYLEIHNAYKGGIELITEEFRSRIEMEHVDEARDKHEDKHKDKHEDEAQGAQNTYTENNHSENTYTGLIPKTDKFVADLFKKPMFVKTLYALSKIYTETIAAYVSLYREQSIIDALKEEQNKRSRVVILSERDKQKLSQDARANIDDLVKNSKFEL